MELIIFTATWGSSYLLPLGVPYLVTVPGVVKFYTGINIIRVRKRAVLRTFLFIKIASLQIESVLQNTIKKPLQWPRASVYRFLLCLTAFVLGLFSRSESSHLISKVRIDSFLSIKVPILKRDFLEVTVKIGDKEFLVYQNSTYQCKLISQYIFVFLSLIEDICTVCIQYFSKKSKDLLISNTFFISFVRRYVLCAYTSFSMSRIHSTIAQIQGNWPIYHLNSLASYLEKLIIFVSVVRLVYFSFLVWCTLKVYLPFVKIAKIQDL